MKSTILVITLIIAASDTNAAIYRCDSDHGKVEFSDIPCPDAVELQVDTSEKMYQGSTWHPSEKPIERLSEKPAVPQIAESPKPRTFSCGDVTVTGFTAYENLAGIPNGGSAMPVAQFQCVTGKFRIRPGLQARWNDRSFAEDLARSISATLQNGEMRTSDRAFLPPGSTASRFKQLNTYNFDLCFGSSSRIELPLVSQ